jgi:hypothetical protein
MGVVVSSESGVVEILENTNWVAIARGGKQGFASALAEMLGRVVHPEFFNQLLPQLPVETTWARNVIGSLVW